MTSPKRKWKEKPGIPGVSRDPSLKRKMTSPKRKWKEKPGVHSKKLAITIIPANGDIHLGESAFFLCKTTGSGEATFQWFKPNGEQVEEEEDEDYRLKPIDESSVGINITVSRADQSGEVRCRAESDSDDETTEQSIHIRVIQRPTFTSNENLYREFQEGSDAEMRCSVTGIPMPTITWIRNGKDVSLLRDARVSVRNGNLQISKVQTSDAGLYSCRASIESRNEVDQKTFTLSVNVPASAHFKNNSTTAMGGTNSTASLICLVAGHPKPQITWSRAGSPVSAVDGKYAFNTDASELQVQNVEKADEGNYTCTARNKLRQDVATITLEVLEVQRSVQPKGVGAGGIVGIVMVIFLVVLLAVDVSCYYTNNCGVLMCLAVNFLGKHPHGGKGHILEDRKKNEKSARCTVVNVSGIEA
ncbi:neural cell adhesion molecule 1-like [Pleurodeles waltl]